MTRRPDSERTALYAAELVAFDGTDLESRLGQSAIAGRVRAVVTGEWWPGPRVEIRRARADALVSSARCCAESGIGSLVIIRLASEQTTVATAAHELAHALAGIAAGHGPEFRAAYLDVIAVITNLDSTDRRRGLHVDQLLDALVASDLEVGGRRWPSPAIEDVGPIVL